MTKPKPQTDIQAWLKEVEQRCEAATQGPWTLQTYDTHGVDSFGQSTMKTLYLIQSDAGAGVRDDVVHAIHSRTYVPKLVAALRVALEALDRATDVKCMSEMCGIGGLCDSCVKDRQVEKARDQIQQIIGERGE